MVMEIHNRLSPHQLVRRKLNIFNGLMMIVGEKPNENGGTYIE